MKYGFVYIWRDRKHKRYYIGSHWGTEDDGYICSSKWMRKSYKRRPGDFKRRIIHRVYTNRLDLLEQEHYYLSMIKNEMLGLKYYNLTNHLNGHWSTDPNKALTIKEKLKAADATRGLRAHAISMRGKNLSEQTKEKISNNTKHGMAKMDKSYRWDEDYRKKISINGKRLQKEGKIGMLGKVHSNKTKEKMSVSQSGSNNPMYNKPHDEEAKRKISEASKLMWAKRRMEKL